VALLFLYTMSLSLRSARAESFVGTLTENYLFWTGYQPESTVTSNASVRPIYLAFLRIKSMTTCLLPIWLSKC